MTPPDDALATWREQFLREFQIDPAPLDENLAVLLSDDTAAGDRIPPRYAAALATDPQIRAWMATITGQAIADGRLMLTVATGPSLLLLGPTGTGKTYEMFGVMRGLVALGLRLNWRAITAADFYARLRPRHGVDSEAEFREFAGARLLALDDLGAGKPSEWTEEVNFRLVNYRYENQLPTLFTSNLPPGELGPALGDRVWSRLAEMTTRAVLRGQDRRFGEGDAA